MVVFTCSHCGESLQKPRVEKHYQNTTCSRNPIAVSCMDCFKDFKLEEYVAHTKCITEEERYSAKGTVHGVKKGEAKQSSWVQTVNTIIEQQQNAKASVKNLLEMISKFDNIPRKQVKFVNFVKSSSGGKIAQNDIDEVWALLEAHKNAAKAEAGQKPEQKKRKSDDAEETTETTAAESAPKKKKKTGKTADDGTGAGAVVTEDSGKSSKKNKRKATDTETEEETVASKEEPAVQTVTTTNGEQPKKKKKKKGKATEGPSAEIVAATVIGNGEGKSKKNKKNKNKNGQVVENGTKVNAVTTAGDTTDEQTKKKNKNKKVEETPATNGTEDSPKKVKGNENGTAENGESPAKQNGTAPEMGKKSKKKNKKQGATTEPNGTLNESQDKVNNDGGFCWRTVIIEEVMKISTGINKEKLRTNVFERYEATKGKIENSLRLAKQYNKKIKKIGNIKIENDLATWVG